MIAYFKVIPAVAVVFAMPALAQTSIAVLDPPAYSSSVGEYNPFGGEDIDGRSIGSSANGDSKIAAPQYGGGGGNGRYHRSDSDSSWSHLAFEAGGGFTAPIGNAANGGFTTIIGNGSVPYSTITWGGNFLVGAGWNFTKRFGLLGEFQYNSNKIPGRTLSAFYTEIDPSVMLSANGIGSIGGNVHTLSVTAEPIFYYFNSDKSKFAGYVIGGGGYYHKSTNFTAPVQSYDPYYGFTYTTNQTFSSYSDSSVGGNLGTGITFKPYGQYSKIKLFAEARYTFVGGPRETAADVAAGNLHTGTEELIPVTFGIRF